MARYVIGPPDQNAKPIIPAPGAKTPDIIQRPVEREHSVHGPGVPEGSKARELTRLSGWARRKMLPVVAVTAVAVTSAVIISQHLGDPKTPTSDPKPKVPLAGLATPGQARPSPITPIEFAPPKPTPILSPKPPVEVGAGPPDPKTKDPRDALFGDSTLQQKKNAAFRMVTGVMNASEHEIDQTLQDFYNVFFHGDVDTQYAVSTRIPDLAKKAANNFTPKQTNFLLDIVDHVVNKAYVTNDPRKQEMAVLNSLHAAFTIANESPHPECQDKAVRILDAACGNTSEPALAKRALEYWDELHGNPREKSLFNIPTEDLASGTLGGSLGTAKGLLNKEPSTARDLDDLNQACGFLGEVVLNSTNDLSRLNAVTTLFTGLNSSSTDVQIETASTLMSLIDTDFGTPELNSWMVNKVIDATSSQVIFGDAATKEVSAAILEFVATESPDPFAREKALDSIAGLANNFTDPSIKDVANESLQRIFNPPE